MPWHDADVLDDDLVWWAPSVLIEAPAAIITAAGPAGTLSMPIDIAAPPADIEVETYRPTTGVKVDAPPALIVVNTYRPTLGVKVDAIAAKLVFAAPPASPGLQVTFTVPPADFTLRAPLPVPEVHVRHAYPSDRQRVPILTPVLSFVVIVADPTNFPAVTAEIQLDDDPGFTSASVFTTLVVSYRGAATTVRLDLTLTEGTRYYWRVRASGDAGSSGWSDVTSFVPDLSVGDGTAYGHWGDVTADTPTGHLWYSDPDHGQPGDVVRLYGKGLGVSDVDVFIGGLAASVTSWTTIAASANAYNSSRTINPETGVIDVEHDEIVTAVPSGLGAPGGAIWVVGT